MPEVSVIIPVYNNDRFVERCVRSVMEQSFCDLEVIAVDDGSTDGSGRILERLAGEDSRIRLIRQENRGVSEARNRGLAEASGTYLTFVDGDDYLAGDYIETLYRFARKNGTDMVICGYTVADENGNTVRRIVPGVYRRFQREEWALRISAVWSHFYRRSLWERYGVRFQEKERGEDMPVSLFFSTVCERIATIPEAGYFYIQHPSSTMHNFRGLKNGALPYRALEETIKKIRVTGVANSAEFYELFVLRILATCFFELAPGAAEEKKRELCDYILRILNTYFPDYYKNKKAGLLAGTEFPFVQKAAVKALIVLARTKLIYRIAPLLRR